MASKVVKVASCGISEVIDVGVHLKERSKKLVVHLWVTRNCANVVDQETLACKGSEVT